MSFRYGIDYTNTSWDYSDSESVWREDFALFQQNKINLICPWLHWDLIEPSEGSYSTSFLNRIKNLCNIAAEYGIQVDVDFHSSTGASSTPSWMPNWCTNFDNVATNSRYKQDWINMQKYVIQHLASCLNIRSYHLFNEPANLDSYYSLFTDTALAVRQITTKPLGLRFGVSQFANTWKNRTWSDYYNFIGINCYIGLYVGHTQSAFRTCRDAILAQGLDIELTEYGWDTKGDWSTQTDSEQQTQVASQIAFYKALPIYTTLITQMGHLYYSTYAFNLYNKLTGLPRPAFYEVAKANSAVPLNSLTVKTNPISGIPFEARKA